MKVLGVLMVGFIASAMLGTACGGSSSSGDGDGDGDPVEDCRDTCALVKECDWAEDIDFEQPECDQNCEDIYGDMIAWGCESEWAAAASCSLDAFDCEATATTESPCESESDALGNCVASSE